MESEKPAPRQWLRKWLSATAVSQQSRLNHAFPPPFPQIPPFHCVRRVYSPHNDGVVFTLALTPSLLAKLTTSSPVSRSSHPRSSRSRHRAPCFARFSVVMQHKHKTPPLLPHIQPHPTPHSQVAAQTMVSMADHYH